MCVIISCPLSDSLFFGTELWSFIVLIISPEYFPLTPFTKYSMSSTLEHWLLLSSIIPPSAMETDLALFSSNVKEVILLFFLDQLGSCFVLFAMNYYSIYVSMYLCYIFPTSISFWCLRVDEISGLVFSLFCSVLIKAKERVLTRKVLYKVVRREQAQRCSSYHLCGFWGGGEFHEKHSSYTLINF